jgi:glycosyltransferase involved in cell wall biosynthesis
MAPVARVLHICNEIGLGGTERGIISMCKVMRYGIFEHEVMCLLRPGIRAGEIAGLAAVHRAADAPEGDAGKGEAAKGEAALKTLAALCAARRFDVVILHRAGGAEPAWNQVLRIVKAAGIARVIEVNIFGLVDTGPDDEAIDCHLHISKTSYCSFRERALAAAYSRLDRHRVLYIPIETARYARREDGQAARDEARRDLGLGPDDFVLVRTGRPDFRKWGDLLLDAIPGILRRIPEARLLLLSAPRTRAWYMARVFPSHQVRVLPATSDDAQLRRAYACADVYVHSSRRGESYGASLVEAMAAGLPVVVNSTPWRDNAQIEVIDHMLTGIIANSPEAFADALYHLRSNPETRRAMGDEGRAKAERLYDAAVVCETLANLVLEMLRQGGDERFPVRAGLGRMPPSAEEIEAYWNLERARREQASWQSRPPNRLARPLRRLLWGVVDACEWLAHRAGWLR